MFQVQADALRVFKNSHGRLLGLDVGTKTLGLSLSDTRWMVATPGVTLSREKIKTTTQEIRQFVDGENLVGCVVGLPRNLDGTLGVMAKSVIDYMHALGKSLELPYTFWDERFTTNAAERSLREGKATILKRGEKIDAIAAAFILQGFLDSCPDDIKDTVGSF